MTPWWTRYAAVLGLLVACNGTTGLDTDTDVDTDTEIVDPDVDEDGSPASEDCDDNDPERAPGLDEVCDGKDNDCNDQIDDDAVDALSFWTDADGDSYGADGDPIRSCEPLPGTADRQGDCDDADPEINPDADEVCDLEDVDEDCDGSADDADESTLRETMRSWFRDQDRDGYGDPDRTTLACDLAPGRTTDNTDCDDTDAGKNPDDGCAGVWDGDWDATLEVDITITTLGLSESCAPTGKLVVDSGAVPAVTAPAGFACAASGVGATVVVGLEAEFDGDDRIEGELDIDGEIVEFTARFSPGPDRLEGSGVDTVVVSSLSVDIAYTLSARRAR